MINGIVSFISFSHLSSWVYRNATNFHVLILYSTILPNSSMSSNSFLVASLVFSMCSIMSSENWKFYFFSNLNSFYFFFFSDCHRTSKTKLSNSGKNVHPSHVLDLRGNSFSFSPLSMMLALGFSHMAFIMLR